MNVNTSAEENVADVIAAAALEVPGVVSLHGGAFGTVATYMPGRRIMGVQVEEGAADVHVTAAYGHDLNKLAAAVQKAVSAVHPGSVSVTIEDIADQTAAEEL